MIHGMHKSIIYGVWARMKFRCYNKNSFGYSHYGGKGIKVCDKWHIFAGFYEDMGEGFTQGAFLERRNIDGDYCKENCFWAKLKEEDIPKIRQMIAEGMSNKEIGLLYNVHPTSIYSVKTGKTWGSVT